MQNTTMQNTTFNVDKSIENIKWIISNMEEKL